MDWFDEVVKGMRNRANKQRNPNSRQVANGFIDVFVQNREGLYQLGKDNVLEYLGMLGRGEKVEAQEFFIRNTQDPEALISGVAGSANTIANAPNIDWAKIATKIALSVGEMGAKILLTFLVGLI